MPYFRLENHDALAAPVAKPLPDVQIQKVHDEWFIVALVDAAGNYVDVKRADNERQAVELAKNVALLGIANFDGQIREVRALVA